MSILSRVMSCQFQSWSPRHQFLLFLLVLLPHPLLRRLIPEALASIYTSSPHLDAPLSLSKKPQFFSKKQTSSQRKKSAAYDTLSPRDACCQRQFLFFSCRAFHVMACHRLYHKYCNHKKHKCYRKGYQCDRAFVLISQNSCQQISYC